VHFSVQRRSEAAQQSDLGLGAALFDALDLILGHASPPGEIRDAQAQGDTPVVQGLATELLDRPAAERGPLDTAEDKAEIARFMRLIGARRRGTSAG
jgi:hypothetical protein